MKTWIALFRGINVMGNNKLPMKDLAALLRRLKLQDPRTYIQSGNAVFASTGTAAALAARISAAIERQFGFCPYVVLLEERELACAVAKNPFPEASAAPASVHLWFLEDRAAAAAPLGLEALRSASERFALHGKVLYLHTPEGFGISRLASRAERILCTRATARNWRTATTLLAMARGEK
ncbi:MAG: DUF1697 domain-containing protein [Steroidobacterales bacterium]|jgi:uncharacterized protein (DUF1697 family)